MKTVGHRARYFEKWCWTFANNFDFIWILFTFSLIKSL